MYDARELLAKHADFVLRLKTELVARNPEDPDQQNVAPAMVLLRDGGLLAHAVLATEDPAHVPPAIETLVLGLKPEAFVLYADAWTTMLKADPLTGLVWGSEGAHTVPQLAECHDGVAKGWLMACLQTSAITPAAGVVELQVYSAALGKVIYGESQVSGCECRWSKVARDPGHGPEAVTMLRELHHGAHHSPDSPLETQMNLMAAKVAPGHKRTVRDGLFARMIMSGYPGAKVSFALDDTEVGHRRADILAAMIAMGGSGLATHVVNPDDLPDTLNLYGGPAHHDHHFRGGLN